MLKKLVTICLNIFFPKYCFGCQKPGTYLCEDCRACLEISQHQYYLNKKTNKRKNLDDLYFSISYQNTFVKKLIHYFKYEPFIKELSESLTSLIIEHFCLLEKPPSFLTNKTNFILIPIPLSVKRLKRRGFNQAEEIAKELTKFLNIPLISDCLIKNQETRAQTELNDKERKENVKGVFLVKNKEKIKNKEILLVDDVYTTGSTMEEATLVLKKAGAKKVIGIVIARG